MKYQKHAFGHQKFFLVLDKRKKINSIIYLMSSANTVGCFEF